MTTGTEQASYLTARELGGIELLKARYQQQNFSKHTHAGYTVGVIETGAQQFYRTGSNHIAPQHSIILVNADQVHTGCAASQGGWSYRALYPLPHQFEDLATDRGQAIMGAPYFPNAVVDDPAMAHMLRHCFDILENSSNTLLRESLLHSSLQQLVRRHSKTRPAAPRLSANSPKLALARAYIHDHVEQDISLSMLANLAGMSHYHFLRQFQKHYELPPHSYQIQLRLEHAKQSLKDGFSLLETAVNLGFHDQSHLHRHFKRAMGVTPGQFAKQMVM